MTTICACKDRFAHIQAPLTGRQRCPRHETGPSTTFNPDPSTIPGISQNPRGVYLRFCFRQDVHGRGMRPKRSRWAGFVAGGPRWCPKRSRGGARRTLSGPADPKEAGGGSAASRRARPAGTSGPNGRPGPAPAKVFPKMSLHRRGSSRIVLLRTGA